MIKLHQLLFAALSIVLLPPVANAQGVTIEPIQAGYGYDKNHNDVILWVRTNCWGRAQCTFKVDDNIFAIFAQPPFSDPAPGIKKEFKFRRRCDNNPGEDKNIYFVQYDIISLECDSSAPLATVTVHSAYWGVGKRVVNVHNGGWDEASGNWLDVGNILASACNGRNTCKFDVKDLHLERHVKGTNNTLALVWRCSDKQTQNPVFPVDDGAFNLITVGGGDTNVYLITPMLPQA